MVWSEAGRGISQRGVAGHPGREVAAEDRRLVICLHIYIYIYIYYIYMYMYTVHIRLLV